MFKHLIYSLINLAEIINYIEINIIMILIKDYIELKYKIL